MMDAITESILYEATDEQLADIYSRIPGTRPGTRHTDRPTTVARIRLALEKSRHKLSRIKGKPRHYRVIPHNAVSGIRVDSGLDLVIRVLVEGNPKRRDGAAYRRFALYRDGMTVGEYRRNMVASGWTHYHARADLAWDQRKGYIKIVDPALP